MTKLVNLAVIGREMTRVVLLIPSFFLEQNANSSSLDEQATRDQLSMVVRA
jgi:hypothetical protein